MPQCSIEYSQENILSFHDITFPDGTASLNYGTIRPEAGCRTIYKTKLFIEVVRM
jgi:hypothetical protein